MDIFVQIPGLRPVDRVMLEAFETEMIERTIPEIVRAVARRHELAAESRGRWLELPVEQPIS